MPAERTVTRTTHPAAPRSLKVTTAAPPPSLEIISPTPRTFTFPSPHNLSDSPESSPSNSPFEPDRAHDLSASSTSRSSSVSSNDECRTPPPISAFTRTLSPVSAPASPSPSPAPIRRKSTSNGPAAEERRPKKGDDDYVKRPENAFILFRRKCCGDRALSLASSSAPSSDASGPSSADSPALAGGKKQRQADLSKTISHQWRNLSPEERAKWEELAKEKKREHEALHPNYVYRPQRTSNKNRVNASASSSASAAQRRKHSAPAQPLEFVIPAPRMQHGRSSSVPAPPPHQAIQIPNVYLPVPSTPFSMENPSLMPMITRRGVRDESGGFMGGFDYMPQTAPFDFEASLQSSNFLRAMFQNSAHLPSTGEILSPASSTSGSGPSSPYTPANASFHPSAFSCTFPDTPVDESYSSSSDMLDASGLTGEPAVAGAMNSDYSSLFASASSPWASSTAGAGLTERDFDIEHISEIEWELGCPAFPAAQPAFPGSEFVLGDGGDMEMGEFGEQPLGGELDLFGNLSMGEIGFDEMMAGRDF